MEKNIFWGEYRFEKKAEETNLQWRKKWKMKYEM